MKLAKSILSLAVISAISPTTFANDNDLSDVENIVVYGGFSQYSLQKSANSVSVISDSDISLRSAQNLEEIIAISPNLNFSSGSQRARYYQIRGIGERSQFQEPINPSVGVIIDDIDFTGIGSISSMFDVKQTEVFRGPQGTRFGANALAGLIYIKSNEPTDEFEGKLKLTAGNYDSFGAGVAFSGPASEAVNYRVAIEQYKSDGFIDNTFLNREDTNNRDELTVRAKMNIDVNPFWQLKLSAFHFDFDNGYDAFSLDNTRETMSDQPGFDRQETNALSVNSYYTKAPHFDITTILSFADTDVGYGYDEDWTYTDMPVPAEFEGWGYTSTDHYFRDKQTATLEMRFESKTHQTNELDWVAGIYLKSDSEDLNRKYTYLDADFDSQFDTETMAVFVQIDKPVTDKLNLSSGLRVERRNADYKNTDGFNSEPDETMVGGNVSLSYQINQDSIWYASINAGYKAGGVNTDGSLADELREFDDERLWNYETGYKVSLLNGDAYLRTALFYMDRRDVQVKTSKTISHSGQNSEFVVYLGNAAKGTNYGVELESAWQISSELELYASVGFLETEYKNYVNADGDVLSGRDQAHAPSYTYNIGFEYFITDSLMLNVSADGKDKFYFSDSHNEKSKHINVINASLSYQSDNWQLNAWIRNISDKDYATRGFFFGNDPRDGYDPKSYYQYGEPRVFGISLNYDF